MKFSVAAGVSLRRRLISGCAGNFANQTPAGVPGGSGGRGGGRSSSLHQPAARADAGWPQAIVPTPVQPDETQAAHTAGRPAARSSYGKPSMTRTGPALSNGPASILPGHRNSSGRSRVHILLSTLYAEKPVAGSARATFSTRRPDRVRATRHRATARTWGRPISSAATAVRAAAG